MTYIPQCIYLYWMYAANNCMQYLRISEFAYLHIYLYFLTSLNQQFSWQEHQGPNSSEGYLPGPNFPHRKLPGPDLLGPNLPGPNLQGANLPGAQFSGDRFSGTQFSGKKHPGPNLPRIVSVKSEKCRLRNELLPEPTRMSEMWKKLRWFLCCKCVTHMLKLNVS